MSDKLSLHGTNWPEGVPFDIDRYELPLFSILDNAAREYPDETYTIFNGSKRTYGQVKDTADRIASFLVSRGINPGDRIAIFLPNIPHYPEVFFGILKAGAVCVTCNPLYKSSELNFQLKDSGARAVFVMDHQNFYDTALKAMEGSDVHTVVICNIKSGIFKSGLTKLFFTRLPFIIVFFNAGCLCIKQKVSTESAENIGTVFSLLKGVFEINWHINPVLIFCNSNGMKNLGFGIRF
jgi:hypothetical protein